MKVNIMRSRFDRELDTLNVDLQKMSGLVEMR